MRTVAFLSVVGLLAAGLFALPTLAAPVKIDAKPKQVVVGPNVVLEIQGTKRRVIVTARVCYRQGPLEGLLTRAKTKEHEYILAADIDARHLHAALIAAGAKPGSPVQFAPKYKAASGTAIKVSLRYNKSGKSVTVPAQQWVRNSKTMKDLDKDWVFAGSKLVRNPLNDDKLEYIANHGDLICTCNMESAALDLPVASPKRLEDRIYEAHTDRIPEKETKVEVIFEPVVENKAAKGK
jgi:hypothetical protein